jgi:hypothetical protein
VELRAEDLRLSSPKLFSEMMERNRWNLPVKSCYKKITDFRESTGEKRTENVM